MIFQSDLTQRCKDKSVWVWVIVFALVMLVAAPVRAQEAALRIALHKQFGFSLGGQIQGTFKLTAHGPADLARVEFKIGNEILGKVNQPPFELTFSTDKYPHGNYELSAVGQTAGGRTIQSNVLHVEFVSAETGWKAAGQIIIPILALVGIVLLAAALGPLWLERAGEQTHPSRSYALLGGTVCPKCGRPFGLHWWAPNLVASKYDRCPHCGKWSVVRRVSREQLAEAATHESVTPEISELDPAEKLRRQIEESRFV
jgi:DNA-directed RNA polymerase subunit RPC12/RpoP